MAFAFQPRLAGALVRLEPLQPADFDALFLAASDPLIWEQHPNPDRYRRDVFRQFFDGALASGGAFTVHDASTGTVIGSTRFLGYRPEASQIEIGYTFLARSHWGGAYNGEMKRLMLRHAFQFVERVVLLIDQHNIRSQRAAETIGAVRAGEGVNAAGRPSLVFAITAERFAAVAPA